jgi:ABC-2 type transport system permease protein
MASSDAAPALSAAPSPAPFPSRRPRASLLARAGKYARLLAAFFRASAIADLEFRFNILAKVLSDVAWYVAQASVFEVLFRHADRVSGWTLESTRVFIGALFVVDSIYAFFFATGLERLSDKVRKGELDLLLAKPVSSQFMLSAQRMDVSYFANFLLSMGWLGTAIALLPKAPSLAQLLLLGIALLCAVAISYSMRFFFSATAMIFDRAENINYLWYQVFRLGTRPDAMYPRWLRYAILTIVPVGFIASVPARMALEAPSLPLVAGALALAIGSVWLTTLYWAYGLKRYSSASS